MVNKRCIIRRKGFTLVELLVVISIIAILLAILMPALSKVKKNAARVICSASLKQWSLGYEMYTNSYNGLFPCGLYADKADSWMKALPKYFSADPNRDSGMYLCAAAKQPFAQSGNWFQAAWGGKVGYAIWGSPAGKVWPYYSYGENGHMRSYSPQTDTNINTVNYRRRWKNKLTITQPSTVPVFGDSSFPISNDSHYYDCRFLPRETSAAYIEPRAGNNGNNANYNMVRFFIDRHELSVNLLMADWSVKRVGLKHLFKLRWHRDWETTMINPIFDKIDWPDWAKNAKDYD